MPDKDDKETKAQGIPTFDHSINEAARQHEIAKAREAAERARQEAERQRQEKAKKDR